MKRLAILACTLLIGCAQQPQIARSQPGLWKDWRAMHLNQLSLLPQVRSIPEELRWEFLNCIADTGIALYTPDELQRLNDHANGTKFMSDAEVYATDEAIQRRAANQGGSMALMRARCPETVNQVEALKG